MWPFNKRESKPNHFEEGISKLKEFRDIGETFNYLGRTCIVTAHYDGHFEMGFYPILKFDYCDDLGVLHNMTACVSELPCLMKQQKSNKD